MTEGPKDDTGQDGFSSDSIKSRVHVESPSSEGDIKKRKYYTTLWEKP
jgi:hypothetical protein